MKRIALINLDRTPDSESYEYPTRVAVRAVLESPEGDIGLMSIHNGSYFKIPGGGVETDEEMIEALKRECREETGFDIEIIEEIGSVLEIRQEQEIKQESFVYHAKTVGNPHPQELTDSEKEKKMNLIWLPIRDAISKIETAGFSNSTGEYIYQRELSILKKATELL